MRSGAKGKGALTSSVSYSTPPLLDESQKKRAKRAYAAISEGLDLQRKRLKEARERNKGDEVIRKLQRKERGANKDKAFGQAVLLRNSRKPAKKTVQAHLEQLTYLAKRAASSVAGSSMASRVSGGVFWERNVSIDTDILTAQFEPYGDDAEANSRDAILSVVESLTDVEIDTDLAADEWMAISLVFSFKKEDYEGGKPDEGPTRKFKRLSASKTRLTVYAQRIENAAAPAVIASLAFMLAERMHAKRADAKLERITVHFQWNPRNEQPAGL